MGACVILRALPHLILGVVSQVGEEVTPRALLNKQASKKGTNIINYNCHRRILCKKHCGKAYKGVLRKYEKIREARSVRNSLIWSSLYYLMLWL